MNRSFALVTAFFVLLNPVLAETGSSREKAEAVLKERCAGCHGPAKAKAELNLISMEGIAKGSESGPVVKPGKAAESELWLQVKEKKMPPKKPLAAKEAAALEHWINDGAPGLPTGGDKKGHWAYQVPKKPPIPKVRGQVRTEIDAFLLATLESERLGFNPEASRTTLIRRVAFDLVGLPPTPIEIATYLTDSSPGAYERMVERYLASPAYGERWGKYWLDAAGYADSNGYFNADTDRPLAYRYRDYVVDSLNRDKPHDLFVKEQLAGDELAGYVPNGDVTKEMTDPLIATHFLRNAQDGTGESDGNPDELRVDRYTVLEGTLHVAMSSLLGITIQCARCHEHKFEPIAHDEYYRLQAIFLPGYNPEKWQKPKERTIIAATRREREEHDQKTSAIEEQIKALKNGLESSSRPFRKQMLLERFSKLEASERAKVVDALLTPEKERTKEQSALIAPHAKGAEIKDEELEKRFPEYAKLAQSTREAISQREKERPAPLPTLAVFVETDPSPPVHHLLKRGQYDAAGPAVEPGVPVAFCPSGHSYPTPKSPKGVISSGRRTAFANWIASPNNPLFSRVMVNRVWRHHFGRGIVATTENLGLSGARPSHPELLDYLAVRFHEDGWRLKSLHRLILSSAAYRQSSESRSEGIGIDPEDLLLWRYPVHRLDAEAIRDSMLAVSGELDRAVGGPYVPTRRIDDGSVVAEGSGERRRSLYLQQRRTQVATMLELFDAPSIVINCAARSTSTVPLQSLALLNSGFARDRGKGFAHRLLKEAGTIEERIGLAFLLAYGRGPGDEELAESKSFIEDLRKTYAKEKDSEQRAWADFCQMLLASSEFCYVD